MSVIPNLNKVYSKLPEPFRVHRNVNVYKVFTCDEETNSKIADIGRVVMTNELILKMGDQVGVALLKKDNSITGFGNIDANGQSEYDHHEVSFQPDCCPPDSTK